MAYKYIEMTGHGNSMLPTLADGDLLTVCVSKCKVKENDIIVITPYGKPIAKRISSMKEENGKTYFWVCGDNAENSQNSANAYGWVSEDDVIGKVTKRNGVKI